MKKKIAALFVLSAFALSLSACGEKAEMIEFPNENQTDVSVSESLETTAQTEEEKHITASAEELNNSTEKGTSNEIPTDGCSDTDFMRRYVDEAENLYIVSQIVGSEEYENWVENVYLAKSSEEQNELPALYQIIHDLNISKEDFVAQNNEFIDYPDMYYSEEVISALYLEDIEEMKKQLVNPLALYYDGEIYTFDELSEAQNMQTAADIPADVMSEYLGYIKTVCNESGILKYMQEDIDSVIKKYQLDSEQAGLNSDEEETGEHIADSSGLLDDIDMLNETCYGMSNDEIHTMFGEPDGCLSGFWGDIYVNSDNRQVIIYYDENGKVDIAILGDQIKQTKVTPYLEGVELAPDDDPPIEDESPD